LPKKFRVEINQRVGGQNQRVGEFFGDVARFAIGIELGNFLRGQLFRMQFGSITRHDAKFAANLPQQFISAAAMPKPK